MFISRIPPICLCALMLLVASCSNNAERADTKTSIKVSTNMSRDSLELVINTHIDDTIKVQALYTLCYKIRKNNPDSALLLAEQARDLAEKLNYIKGLSFISNHMASIYRMLGNYDTAIAYNKMSYLYAS